MRLSRFVIIGIIAAEVVGWLWVLGLWHFYSIGMHSQYGLAVPVALLAVGGATAGLLAWVIASGFQATLNICLGSGTVMGFRSKRGHASPACG